MPPTLAPPLAPPAGTPSRSAVRATTTAIASAPGAGPAARIGRRVEPFLLPAALLALWTLGAAQGWISPQVLPPPLFVWETLRDLATSGDLWMHAAASLQRVLVGFVVGSLIGVALGTAMGLSKKAEAYLLPTFNALVQIPVLGWMPFVLLLVGIGEPLKYILIAKAALVPVALNTLQGFRQAPPTLREVGRVYGYDRRQEVLEIVLPTALPTLFTGLRLGFTKAWLSLVVVELVASSEGLGYLIVYGRQLFQLDLVMAAVIVVGALGYAIDRLLDAIERRVQGRHGAIAGDAP
jgi:sulfonate transport system permease protein